MLHANLIPSIVAFYTSPTFCTAKRCPSNGAADKLQGARKSKGFFAVSLIRVLDGAERRTTGGGSAAPLNGHAASVQHRFKPQRSLSALSALKTVLGVILYLKVNLLNLLFLSLYKKLLCYISKFHFPFQHRYTLLKYHFSLLFCTKEMLVPFHFHSYS